MEAQRDLKASAIQGEDDETERAPRRTVQGTIVRRPVLAHPTYLAVVNPKRIAPARGASRPNATRRHGYRTHKD